MQIKFSQHQKEISKNAPFTRAFKKRTCAPSCEKLFDTSSGGEFLFQTVALRIPRRQDVGRASLTRPCPRLSVPARRCLGAQLAFIGKVALSCLVRPRLMAVACDYRCFIPEETASCER